MKEYEFSNLIETNISAELPKDWPDKPEAAQCPSGWLLLIDAENEVIGMAPNAIALMLVQLFNSVEKTNAWEDPHG